MSRLWVANLDQIGARPDEVEPGERIVLVACAE
jgi:hypothetical protein